MSTFISLLSLKSLELMENCLKWMKRKYLINGFQIRKHCLPKEPSLHSSLHMKNDIEIWKIECLSPQEYRITHLNYITLSIEIDQVALVKSNRHHDKWVQRMSVCSNRNKLTHLSADNSLAVKSHSITSRAVAQPDKRWKSLINRLVNSGKSDRKDDIWKRWTHKGWCEGKSGLRRQCVTYLSRLNVRH